MSRKKKERILFSCVGTSDPVRGFHDGGMLHIVRHYRPERILWYITAEMKEYEEKDNRYRRSIECLQKQLPDYHPEILEPYYDDRKDASDYDAFYEPFYNILQKLTRDYPNAEILVNLSSGTPQIKMTLAIMANSLQFRIRAIQVKYFGNKAAVGKRTNDKDYDLKSELKNNKDIEPDAENRCHELQLIFLQRERCRTQVESLLKRYDYEALKHMKGVLPDRVLPLVQHLACRACYDTKGALEDAAEVSDMELYPADNKNLPGYEEYRQMSEYLMVLKLMQRTQRFTDFLIRLNPFVIRLQRTWLVKHGVCFSDFCCMDNIKGEVISRGKLREKNGELLSYLDRCYHGEFHDTPLNISICNHIIEFLNKDGKYTDTAGLFGVMEQLNYLRNDSAHELTNVTEDEIFNVLGFSSGFLIKKMLLLLGKLYPEHFREELFSIYDDANSHIIELLR